MKEHLAASNFRNKTHVQKSFVSALRQDKIRKNPSHAPYLILTLLSSKRAYGEGSGENVKGAKDRKDFANVGLW